MNNSRITDFLERHGFRCGIPSDAEVLANYATQMRAGLTREPQSLAMLPSYLDVDKNVPVNSPVIVMDAGGTHLRTAVLWFDAKGRARIEDFNKLPMPGSGSETVGAERFFEILAEPLEPLVSRAGTLGLCFSYPTEISPTRDGRLLRWTKEIKAPGVEGEWIGAGLVAALRARTGAHLRVCVLNDTVATLLAGRAAGISRRFSSYVGYILGTGANMAYVEKTANITKLGAAPGCDRMVINVESGNFDGIPLSEFDEMLDATLTDRGAYRFEKMTGGAYLGSLGLRIYQQAAREGLFSERASSALLEMRALTSKDFDDFAHNPFMSGTAFDAVPLTDDDRRTIIALASAVFKRAARLVALNIAAAVIGTEAGRDPLHPVCVTVDGSTFYRTRMCQFRSLTEAHLREALLPHGIHYELISVDDAPMLGAAVAGLTL